MINIDDYFVKINPGTFVMGSPYNPCTFFQFDPVKVTLTCPFLMAKVPVTQGLWFEVMQTKPWLECSDSEILMVGPDYPAVNMNWHEACRFCSILGALLGRDCTLPTEAQWEYAAKAGTTTNFYWGDSEDFEITSLYGAFTPPEEVDETRKMQPVGRFLPNQWGLYDMLGNIIQFVFDSAYSTHFRKPGYYPVEATDWYVSEGDYCIARGSNIICSYAYPFEKNIDDKLFYNELYGFRVAIQLTPLCPTLPGRRPKAKSALTMEPRPDSEDALSDQVCQLLTDLGGKKLKSESRRKCAGVDRKSLPVSFRSLLFSWSMPKGRIFSLSDTEGVVYYNEVEWFSATISSFESLHIGDNDADLILVGFAGSGEVLMALSLNDECPSDPTVYMLEPTDDFDPSVHSEGKFSSFLKRLILE